MKPKLQLALDTTEADFAFQVVEELADLVDIVEIGTPLLLAEGLHFVRKLRTVYPSMELLVDTKIIDSGEVLSRAACQAGAGVVTVVSAANPATLQKAVESAHALGSKVLLDHLSADWDAVEVLEKTTVDVDYLGLHIPKDMQGCTKLDPARVAAVLENSPLPVFLAGGLDAESIRRLIGLPIAGFVIGAFLLNGPDRRQKAAVLREILDEWRL